mmetsp:Transcript_41425/g.117233  ORF Transcript_41425/g.117233 Transcript_41425/m.117233 type:complete len:250 (-) Transcript_41425:77-826(-)
MVGFVRCAMAGELQASAWSRDTSADSCGADGGMTMSLGSSWTSAREELLRTIVGGSGFAVMLLEPSSHSADEVRIRAASRGFQEMFEWREASLLGTSGRMLEAHGEAISLAGAAGLRVAGACGAPFSCMRTTQKASGELCRVWQYVRGLSFGRDWHTGEEVWYAVAVHLDVTEDDSASEEDLGVEALDASARRIAECVRSSIADVLAPRRRQGEDDAGSESDDCAVRRDALVWKRGDVEAQLLAAGVVF